VCNCNTIFTFIPPNLMRVGRHSQLPSAFVHRPTFVGCPSQFCQLPSSSYQQPFAADSFPPELAIKLFFALHRIVALLR
jgi:hypothetical protein